MKQVYLNSSGKMTVQRKLVLHIGMSARNNHVYSVLRMFIYVEKNVMTVQLQMVIYIEKNLIGSFIHDAFMHAHTYSTKRHAHRNCKLKFIAI